MSCANQKPAPRVLSGRGPPVPPAKLLINFHNLTHSRGWVLQVGGEPIFRPFCFGSILLKIALNCKRTTLQPGGDVPVVVQFMVALLHGMEKKPCTKKGPNQCCCCCCGRPGRHIHPCISYYRAFPRSLSPPPSPSPTTKWTTLSNTHTNTHTLIPYFRVTEIIGY